MVQLLRIGLSIVLGRRNPLGGAAGPVGDGGLLLEDGSFLLLESGDFLLLE